VYGSASGARPTITYTLAALNATQAYVHFSGLVYGTSAGGALGGAFLSYTGSGSNPIVSITPTETSGNGAHAAIVTFTNPLSAADIVTAPQTLSAAGGSAWGPAYPAFFQYGVRPPGIDSGNPGSYPNATTDGLLPGIGTGMLATAHNVSDFGMGIVTPVFALDTAIERDPSAGGLGLVTVFDGTKWLPPQNAKIEARIMVPGLSNATMTMYWSINAAGLTGYFNSLWMPTASSTLWSTPGNLGGDSTHLPGSDGDVGAVSASSASGALRDFTVLGKDLANADGKTFQFMFVLDDGAGHRLPMVYAADPANPASVRPFAYDLHSIITQRAGVTITNNIINPTLGQVAYLRYTMDKDGPVTVTVFSLSGEIVRILQRASMTAGEHTTAWDGKNTAGTVVARGVYFIRVVGPGFDETRKVLVVK
jgi:hypothetical protein